MFLVKCECGCFYTLQDEQLKKPKAGWFRTCPGCGADHRMDDNPTLEALSKMGIELMRIPDNTKIRLDLTL